MTQQAAAKTRVTVVEDERIVALHLKRQLSQLGYDVVAIAASGEDALQKVLTLRPDVVLMDIHIEGKMDGVETARRIASAIEIPVIYVTAYSEEATLERARSTKPYGFLVKPFSERELHATIQIALERRQWDSALQASEQDVKRERDIAQRYLDVAGVMILALDRDASVTLINRRGCEILGCDDAKAVIGKPWIDTFIPEPFRDEVRTMHRRLVSGDDAKVEFYTSPVLTKRGEERLIAWHNAIMTDENGHVSASLSSGEDITERERVAENLRLSEERFRSIYSAVSEGIFIVDANTGAFVDVNAPGTAMFGYAPGELNGRDVETLSSGVPPYTQRGALEWIETAATSGRPQRIEWHCKTKDGRLFWTEISLRSASIGNRDVVLAVVRDITERRSIETQLYHAQKMEAIGNLTGGMAHDFNNILGVVIGNLDLLRDTVKSQDEQELTRDALEAALRGADLNRRLLAFARRQPLQPQCFDVNALVGGITKLLSRALGEDIEITVDPAPDLWRVVADPAQLEAAVTNLATNARDAMPNGGRLIISTRNTRLDEDYAASHVETVAGDYIVIEVSDTGSGIEPAILGKIFEPFFTTKDEGKGTGLGLSMVFGFIRQSGGHVNVYSEPGDGTTFRLYLPRAIEGAAVVEAEAEEPARGDGETVLVVEDNAPLRRIVVKQLTELGYRVIPVATAAAALAVLDDAADIDLLLTDVIMPGGLNGLELARQVRMQRPTLKLLLTSGFPVTRIGETGRELDARLLSKPYRKSEMARTIREVLDS